MSDSLKHECGIALIRLLKPLSYYQEKYGSNLYGLKKLYLLMVKQQNRGQDGAGVGVIKIDPAPGKGYIARERSNRVNSISEVFSKIYAPLENATSQQLADETWLKENFDFSGELMVGHLRYGTHGKNGINNIHPFLRENNWMCRNLVLAGNFNLTNVDDLFQTLVNLGQHPKEKSDNVTVLEKIGHFLDEENQRLFEEYKLLGYSNKEISQLITSNLSVSNVLKRSFKNIDGGYAMCGLIGNGDAFIIRDPSGIRPAFYYQDDEIVVVTSERPAIQTAFNVLIGDIKEIKPGHALIIDKNGQVAEEQILEPMPLKSCSFERIYFSRGNDAAIYKERKRLGYLLSDIVLEKINYDLDNTVFSYIPNTAATAFYGMIDGVHDYLVKYKAEQIRKLGDNINSKELERILALIPRREKIAVKDAKLRTFITDDSHREDLVAHVYDVTYGIIRDYQDTLVVIDDSIVRGTTLKQSILRILDRLRPKKIIIVSSAPQIRYPDCYGIDMSRMNDFVAFQAVVQLLKERNLEHKLDEVYDQCVQELTKPIEEMTNKVKQLYELFTYDEITHKISDIITPGDINADVEVVYQTLDNLHEACPGYEGDWYFSGDYPTPGGNRVANKAFVYYMQGIEERAY